MAGAGSFAARLAMSAVMGAWASSSSGVGDVMGGGAGGFCRCGRAIALGAKLGRAKTHRNTIHARNLDRTGTSQRVGRTLLYKIIRRAKKKLATEDVEEHGGRNKSQSAGSGFSSGVYSALMLDRNSLLPLVLLSLSISNSMASTGESGFSTLRNTQMRDRSSLGIRSSSLRVPER